MLVKMMRSDWDATASELMMIEINLSPELEAQLRKKAIYQGQDISLVAAELLANVLEWEVQDSEEAIKGIQQGLDDFEAGNFRSFDRYAAAQRRDDPGAG